MTCWRTDRPIPPVPAVRGLPPAAALGMFRTDAPARVALSAAWALSLNNLRMWAKKRKTAATSFSSPNSPDDFEPL